MADAPQDPEQTGAETEATTAAETAPARPRRKRRGIVTVLFVLATVIGIFAIAALWVNRQVLNTDNWTDTSAKMLADPTIRATLAAYMVDEIFDNVDVQGQLEEALPGRTKALAGPAAAGLRDLADRAAPQVLAKPRVQQAWEQANRVAHTQLLKVLEDRGKFVSTGGGDVVLNLRTLIDEMALQLGVSSQVASVRQRLQGLPPSAKRTLQQKLGLETLPNSAGQITILHSDELETAQKATKAVKGLAVVLTALMLILFALAVFLASGWRRVALRTTGWCFFGVGLVVLIGRRIGGDQLVNALVPSTSVRPAVHIAWETGTALLYAIAVAAMIYGIMLVLAAWLAGPTRPAVAVRRALAPSLEHRIVTVYGVAAILFLLFILWGPTPATRKVWGVAIIGVLVALGVWMLREQTKEEFPDAQKGDTMARLRGSWNSMQAKRAARKTGAPQLAASSRVDELERLTALHDRGVLDDTEFARQKTLILEGG